MNSFNETKGFKARRPLQLAVLVVVVGAILAGIYFFGATEAEEKADPSLPVVNVTTALQFAGASTVNLIGTVRAFSEAAITSEKSGRVTGVRVSLGDAVSAGAIIATLENAAESASVLQAEGVYDAAVSAAAQSGVGINEANTNLNRTTNSIKATVNSALNTVNDTVVTEIDVYYNQPNSPAPRLEIGSDGQSRTMELKRVEIGERLESWKAYLNNQNTNYDPVEALDISENNIVLTLELIDIFLSIFMKDEDVVKTDTFSALRSSLINTQLALDNERTALESATDTVRRAQLSAAGGSNSAADAQVKQALGSLRAAQAQFAKTIIRTPISGTVNALDIRTGDFVNSFVQVAQVANNNALEIITFAGEKDRAVITIGDEVLIENEFTGVVTEVAPAVDPGTGKTEVRIASESPDLQNGNSVQITKQVESTVSTDVIIPLTAVKFALNDGTVFMIENDRLTPRTVTLGTIRGGSVEILDGLEVNEEFVVDARGLVEATEVEVIR